MMKWKGEGRGGMGVKGEIVGWGCVLRGSNLGWRFGWLID